MLMIIMQKKMLMLPTTHQVALSCRTDDQQWFFCLWHSPTRDKQCAIQVSPLSFLCYLGLTIIIIVNRIVTITIVIFVLSRSYQNYNEYS